MSFKRACRCWAAILAVLLALAAVAGWAEAPANPEPSEAAEPHNTILVIDNSRSTTGRHSLGEATDPKGLRFDAARLVYQNVASSAATGGKGKIGVIVFCGPDNCVSYGPLEIDDAALDEAIGSKLNAAANAARRDDYTDIRTALQTAKDMMAGFDGDTSVLLLTDGVNDLTNRTDPFSRPENIQANDDSVALAGDIAAEGADFNVVALTAQEAVENTDAFMVFINRLAEAGGGEMGEDGAYNNVLMATQGDLNSKLLQSLIKAESASETIQTIVETTPVDAPFTVPYTGITDATVNLTFMPEDKALLESAALVAPDGTTYDLWDADGAHDQAGITVTESRSYLMFAIPTPREGDWRVVVNSKGADGEAAAVPINAVVRFNHSMRLRLAMDETLYANESARIEAWFQHFNGEQYEDLTDSDIYGQSEAVLTVVTPSGNERTVDMKRSGDRYVTSFRPKVVGAWEARVTARNPYVKETTDTIAFEVLPERTPEPTAEPTPEPTPEASAQAPAVPAVTGASDATPEPTATPTPRPTVTPTPTPEVIPITSLALSIEPSVTTEEGEILLKPGSVTFSWTLEEETDEIEAVLLKGESVLGTIASGMSFDSSFFKPGQTYDFRVTALPKNGQLVGAEPTVETLTFRAPPQPIAEENILLSVEPLAEDADETPYVDRAAEQFTVAWQIAGETDAVEAALLEDGETLVDGLQSGDSLDRALLKDGATYTLRVSALPQGGALVDMAPTVAAMDFALYPQPDPVEGLTLAVSGADTKDGVSRIRGNSAKLAWSVTGGNIDHYRLTAVDANGGIVADETLKPSESGYTLKKPAKTDVTVRLDAVARYAPAGEKAATASVKVHSLTFLEQYWMFIAGGAVLLLGAVAALLLVLKNRNAKHVTGALRVRCEALGLDQPLTFFDDSKGVKVGEPITRHATLAKLKGKKAYALLSNVRMSNVQTDRDGRAPGESEEGDALHRANVRVLCLTYTDPKTKQSETRCVGRYDVTPATLNLSDGSGTYEFTFSGS